MVAHRCQEAQKARAVAVVAAGQVPQALLETHPVMEARVPPLTFLVAALLTLAVVAAARTTERQERAGLVAAVMVAVKMLPEAQPLATQAVAVVAEVGMLPEQMALPAAQAVQAS